jgi:protoheme IX farnesyltransferase
MSEYQYTTNTAAVELTRRESASAYYELTKPGITLMVVVSTAAGFWLALPKHFAILDYLLLFIATVVGTALVSAGSCVLNHVMEHRYDLEMKRTMFRPIPSGKITTAQPLTAGLAALTLFLYLAVYTPLKRVTPLSTLVGGIPGALPPLGGYATVTGSISLEAGVLFMILFLWQMPHFFSLAWMYRKDYERGGFRMLTALDESGMIVAKHIVSYTILLLLFSLLPTVYGDTGLIYFGAALLLGGAFLAMGLRFMHTRSNTRARAVLLTSYLYLLALLTLMFIDKA